MKDMTSTLANNMGKIASLPSDKIMALTPQIDLMIKTGNMEGLKTLLNNISEPVSIPQSTIPNAEWMPSNTLPEYNPEQNFNWRS